MNETQMRGLRRRTNRQMTRQSTSIKVACGKSGGCVPKAVELTSRVLPIVPESELLVERSILPGRQTSKAELVWIAREAGKERKPERPS